jgi:hypothetical protein
MVDSITSMTLNLSKSQLVATSNNRVMSSKTNHLYCNQNGDNNHPFTVYHQNIQGLKFKVNEFMFLLFPEMPHLICLPEHNLKYNEINITHIPDYNLGTNYCRSSLKCGGVCIFITGGV